MLDKGNRQEHCLNKILRCKNVECWKGYTEVQGSCDSLHLVRLFSLSLCFFRFLTFFKLQPHYYDFRYTDYKCKY